MRVLAVTLYDQHICLERVSCVLSLMVSTEKYFSIANARDEPHLPVSRARRRAVGSTVSPVAPVGLTVFPRREIGMPTALAVGTVRRSVSEYAV